MAAQQPVQQPLNVRATALATPVQQHIETPNNDRVSGATTAQQRRGTGPLRVALLRKCNSATTLARAGRGFQRHAEAHSQPITTGSFQTEGGAGKNSRHPTR